MRSLALVAAIACAACGSPPAPHLHFSGDPERPLAPSPAVALTSLVGGEIRVDSAWHTCTTKHPRLDKGARAVEDCDRATAQLTVTCTPDCTTERRGPETIIVHPPGAGRLVVTATTVRDSNHEKLGESRIYDVVVAEDIGLLCRDAHGAEETCDLPQNGKTGTVEVVAYVHGKLVERVAGIQIDGKVVEGTVALSDIVDVHTPGLHTVELTGAGLHKKTVIAIAPSE